MESVFENLPPSYKTAALKLHHDVETGSNETKNSLILGFANDYWKSDFNEFGIAVNVKSWIFKKTVGRKCKNNLGEGLQEAEKLLKIPCDALEEIYKIYLQFSTKSITKTNVEKYQKTLNLLNELHEAGSNTHEFTAIINKLDDNDKIIASFEYFLLSDYTDKTIWKNYINFLSNVDKQKMLMGYKHYTRFFIEDKEMVNEYRQKIEEIPNVSDKNVWMADTVAWEFKFGDEDYGYSMIENYHNSLALYDKYKFSHSSKNVDDYLHTFVPNANTFHSLAKNLKSVFSYFEPIDVEDYNNPYESDIEENTPIQSEKRNFNSENAKNQDFDFQSPVLRYVFNNVSLAILQKLYQSCKYFYETFKTPLCYRLIIGGTKTQCFQQSLQVSDVDIQKPKFQEFIKQMKVVNCLQWNLNDNNISMIDVLKKENITQLKYVYIKGKESSVDELIVLLKQ